MKYLVKPAALLAVLSLPGLSLSVHAEESKPDTTLETVVVTATRSEQTSVITPTAVSIITADEIQKSGAKNLVDILRIQAGIQLQDTIGDGSRAVIGMRGFSATASNNVLIMIDGRKLNNASQEAPALSSISTQNIERIEIIQGSAGVLYGDQAVAGAINIITKTPAQRKFYVETSRGTDDLENYRGSASQQFDNGLAYRVSVDKKLADNYRDNNEANYTNYSGRVDYTADKAGVFIEQQYINDNLNYPGPLSLVQADDDRQQTFYPSDFGNRDIAASRLGGNVTLTDSLEFLAEFTDRDNHGSGFIGGAFGTDFTADTDFKSFNPRLAGKMATEHGEATYTAGADFEESQYKTSYGGFSSSDFEQEQQAVYGQLNYPVAKNMFLSGGYREASVEDDNKAFGLKHDDTESAKELGVSYYGIQNTRLFARMADAFRFANADDNGFVLPGVAFLKPQTSRSHEIGVEYTAARFSVLAQLYDMELDNEIFYDSVIPNPLSWSGFGANLNLDSSQRRGLLLEGNYRATDALQLFSNYTYTDAELSSGSFKGNEVPYVAEHKASLGGSYHITAQWSAYADATYTGSQYRSGDEANNAARVAAYWLANANLQWQQDALSLSLRLNNITDEEYEAAIYATGNQYPAAERNLQFTVGYDF